jgi:nitrogen fixation NifU-like protein
VRMYSEEILRHFQNPQHVGDLVPADGVGIAHGGQNCPNDIAHFWIRVDKGRIVEIGHKTKGCPVAIASSSMTAELAEGRTLEEAEALTPEMVADALGGMPERKFDSIVGPLALRNAIADYRRRCSDTGLQAEAGGSTASS